MARNDDISSDILTFLIIADLHGKIPKISKIHENNFDAIICPGDICGDELRKYIQLFIKKRTTNPELEFSKICSESKEKLLNKKSLKKGRKVLEYLNSFEKPVFIVPGNWDQTPYLDGIINNENFGKNNPWEKIKANLKNIVDIENKKIIFKDIIFIGHGSTSAPEILIKKPLSNFDTKEDFNEYMGRYEYYKKVEKILESYFIKEKNSGSSKAIILLSHNVPYKTKLDKVNSPNTYAHNKHYGSILAKNLILKYQPLISIAGHIHEGYGETMIKETKCINAGFGENINIFLKINRKTKKIVNIEFIGKNKK